MLPGAGASWAQQGPALQAHSVVVSGRPWFAGAGLGASLGLTLRTAVGLTASFGVEERRAAARAEVLASFYLSAPGAVRVNPYLAGGAALTWSGVADRQYMVLAVGVERRLGGRVRGFLEAGVGGGWRAAAGLRAAP